MSRHSQVAQLLSEYEQVSVAIPRGCLLVQAGKQLEWLTAGHVRAGMHEVSLGFRV